MSGDIFVPKNQVDNALVGPLHTITYLTSEPERAVNMLSAGMGLSASATPAINPAERERLSDYLGLKGLKWDVQKLNRTDSGSNVQIRLISVDDSTPLTRPAVDGSYLGGLSIGFPTRDSDGREARMSELGFKSVVGVKRLELQSPSGETYVSEETHYTGPENIYVLAVRRPDIFVPVGPLNSTEAIGAPAYSAQCVMDADAVMNFYESVLGFETRRDMTMTVGDRSGLKLPEGTPERFVQCFAPGSQTGYLVFLEHPGIAKTANNLESFGPPSRGVAMWSFPTTDIDEVARRATESGATVSWLLSENGNSPLINSEKSIIIRDPNGFPVEIFQIK